MSSTIATTTNANPFEYPGMTLLCREPANSGPSGSGRYVCLVKASTADNYVMYKSTDGPTNWSSMTTIVRTNVVDVGAIFMDKYEWLFWVYRTNESSQDRIYIRRINAITGVSSSEVLLDSPGNGGVAGAVYQGMDIKTHYHTNGWHYIAVAVGYASSGNQGVKMLGAQIDPSGNIIAANYTFSGTTKWLFSGTAGRVTPSLDLEADSNGYDGWPNLWVAYGRTHLHMGKIPWTGGGWTGSSGDVTLASNIGNVDYVTARWDGSYFYVAIPDPVNTSKVVVYRRNRGNSSTKVIRTPDHTNGVVKNCVLSYKPQPSNDFRIWAVGTTNATLYAIDYAFGTDSFGAWTSTAHTMMGTNVDNYGAKRSTDGDSRWGLYYATSGAPNTLTYEPVAVATNPATPTWTNPVSGAPGDVNAALVLSWTFFDIDPADTQGYYAVSRQIGAGALNYWRSSDSTWQTTEQQNASATSSLTLASGWAAGTDANYTFKVKVWDVGSMASGYSSGMVVVPSVKVNPTITSPTAAQVIGTSSVTCTWTVAEETKFRIRLNITAGALVYDSGWVTSTALTYTIPYSLVNATSYTITLDTANLEGLPSSDVTVQFSTSFTPPSTPTLAVAANSAAGAVTVAITNPAGAPSVQSQDLFRRVVGDTSAGIRIGATLSPGVTVQDWKAVHGVNYEYQVLATSTTGSTATSTWTS